MNAAICIACGCDEDHGCPPALCKIQGADSCFWLDFDADKKVGICSECGDFLGAWKQGQREPMLALISVRYYRQALSIADSREAALAWLASPNPLLSGRAPRELLLEGHIEAVQTVLDQLRSWALA